MISQVPVGIDKDANVKVVDGDVILSTAVHVTRSDLPKASELLGSTKVVEGKTK